MKRLLSTLSRKWPEYLLEILVLIIGIYGAFMLDNWNEERKDKIREQKVLARLKQDFENDLEQIESRNRLRHLVIRSAQQAIEYIDKPNGVSIDSIYYKISPLFYTTTFDPIEHKLMESGDIHLIESEELKHHLSTWPSFIIQLKELEFEYLNTFRNITIPFFIETGLGRGVDHAIWTDETFYNENIWIGEIFTDSTAIKKPTKVLDAMEVLQNKKLESILTNAITINSACQIEAHAVKKRIEEILKLIEASKE